MEDATQGSPRRLETIPESWHPLPLAPATKKALMESFSHYENFSYDEFKGGFLVEVPVPPGRAKIPRATPAVLKDHVEIDIKLTRGGNCATRQPRRPLEECYSWWLGQLIHYDLQLELSADEAKHVVKNAMVQGVLKVPAHLRKMEQSMRNAARRRARKRELRLAAKRSTFKEPLKNIKIESATGDSDHNDDIVPTPEIRGRVQAQTKIKDDTSSESDAARDDYSSDSETDSDTIDYVPPLRTATKNTKSIEEKKTATVKAQTMQVPRTTISVRKTAEESSSDSESDEEEEDIRPRPVNGRQDEDSTQVDSDSCGSDSLKMVTTKAQQMSEDSDADISDAGSFSGDSEYKRAVVSNSQAIDRTRSKYGATDTEGSSESSSDDEVEYRQPSQFSGRKAHQKLRAAQVAPTFNTTKTASKSTLDQISQSKQLKIKRDRKSLPEELERASTRDTTPYHTPKKRLKRGYPRADSAVAAKPPTGTANVHPGMTYEDVHDQIMRGNIAKMRGIFPRETIHLCYICLVKANGNYDMACEELVNATTVATPKKPAQAINQEASTPASSRKRKRSSSTKAAATAQSPSAKSEHRAPAILSDSDKPTVKQEPGGKQRRSSCFGKGSAAIPDHMHGSQIDLTISEDEESSSEAEIDPRANKRIRKSDGYQRSSPADKPTPKTVRTVSVEIPSPPAPKPHLTEKLKSHSTFPSSPPVRTGLKGILKSSPSFLPRESLLNQALNSAAPPSSRLRSTLPDLPPSTRRSQPEPELPPQPPLKRPQHNAAPQYRVSSNSYITESGWQALNPNSKSKVRPSGQIEEEAQPEPRGTLFPPKKNHIIGLSRQDSGGMLQRGIVRNPSISNSTSTKKEKQHRQRGF